MKSSVWSWTTVLAALTITAASPLVISGRAVTVTTSDIANMTFYAQYAASAYCNSANTVGQAIVCISNACPAVTANGATTAATFSGNTTDIQGLIAVDPTRHIIVVSFRGSASIRNWIANVEFTFESCSLVTGCQVHTGFADAWSEVSSAVATGLAAAQRANPGYPVVVTGHSLGGAVATLAAAYLRAAGTAADLYTYGSPRVGNNAFATFVSAQPGLGVRVTHLDDPVPRLPPLLFGFYHTTPEYWLSDGTATTTVYGPTDIQVCQGTANTSCNGGTSGLDIVAHGYYLDSISGCSTSFDYRKRADPVSLAELENRLNAFTTLDIQYAAALADGAAS